MTVQEIASAIQAVCALGGFVFAAMAWWKARHVPALQKAVVDVADKVQRVEHATNGMKKELEESARRQGFRAGVAQETEKADAVAAGVATVTAGVVKEIVGAVASTANEGNKDDTATPKR